MLVHMGSVFGWDTWWSVLDHVSIQVQQCSRPSGANTPSGSESDGVDFGSQSDGVDFCSEFDGVDFCSQSDGVELCSHSDGVDVCSQSDCVGPYGSRSEAVGCEEA